MKDHLDSKSNAVVDLALRLVEAREDNARLRETLTRCRSVFVGWLEDADPSGELAQGESADKDAAMLMLNLINETLKQTP